MGKKSLKGLPCCGLRCKSSHVITIKRWPNLHASEDAINRMEVRDGYRTSTATGALPSAVLTVRIPVAHSQLLVSVSLQQSSNCHSILSQFCSNWTALQEHCCHLIPGLFPFSLAFTSSSEMLMLHTRLKLAIPLTATPLLPLLLAPDSLHAISSTALLFRIGFPQSLVSGGLVRRSSSSPPGRWSLQ